MRQNGLWSQNLHERTMEEKLEKLVNVPGIEAVFIYNNRAKTMLHLLKRSMDDELIEEIGRHIIQIFCVQSQVGLKEFHGYELIFDKGSLITYNDEYYTIVIWATKSAQMSIVGLNASLVISSLKNDKNFMKLLKKNKIESNFLLRPEYIDKNDELLLTNLT